MVSIMRQVVIIFISFLVIAFSINSLTYNTLDNQRIDSGSPGIYGTETRYVVYGRNLINKQKANLLMLGASNVREGFRPLEMPFTSEHFEIQNMAVGASNFSQIEQVSDLLREVPFRDGYGKSVVLIGLWYGIFVSDQARWGTSIMTTDIERELLRYNLYIKKGTKVLGTRSILPPIIIPQVLSLMQTSFKLTDRLLHLRRFFLNRVYGTEAPARESQSDWIADVLIDFNIEFFRNPIGPRLEVGIDELLPVKEKKRLKALAFWNSYFGSGMDSSQFDRLSNYLKDLDDQGITAVLVDMPLPEWHKSRSPIYSEYQKRKQDIYGIGQPAKNIHYINLQDISDESGFYDSAHPYPKTAVIWSRKLDVALKDTLHLNQKKHLLFSE